MNEVCGDGLWQRWKINPSNTIQGEGMEEEIPGEPWAPHGTALCICVWAEVCTDTTPGAPVGILQPRWTLRKTAMPTYGPAITKALNTHQPPPPSRWLVEENKPSKLKPRSVKYSHLQQHSEVTDAFFPGMF